MNRENMKNTNKNKVYRPKQKAPDVVPKKSRPRGKGLISGLQFDIPEIPTSGNYDKEHLKRWAELVERLKSRGPDLRLASSSTSVGGLFSNNVIGQQKITVDSTNEATAGVAYAVVSHALQHGYRSHCAAAGNMNYPYLAACFIQQTFNQVMLGDQAKVPKIKFPDFLLEMLAAVAPKMGVQVGTGTVGYSWSIPNSTLVMKPVEYLPLSSTPYGRYVFGNTSPAVSSSGYNLITSSPASYTSEQGQEAFSDLANYFNDRLTRGKSEYDPYSLRDFSMEGTELERSVSAFSSTNLVIGGGVKGGFAYGLAALETTIKHPKFAVFADPSMKLARGFRQYHAVGGDTLATTMSILNQTTKGEFRNPNYYCWKPVDFYEFADRLARSIVSMFQLYYNDTTFTNKIPNLGISAQAYLIILRKVLMSAFSATQYGVQSLRFYTSGSSDEFIPFLVSCATSNSDVSGTMTLPLYAAENINALTARCIWPNINPRTRTIVKRNPKIYVPVLGIYTKSSFDPKRYTYETGEGAASIFTSNTLDVGLVDGSSGNDFVDLDTSPAIFEHMESYNKAMRDLTPYIQSPIPYAGDAGASVLTIIGDTYFVHEKAENDKVKDPGVTVYNKQIKSKLSQQIPFRDIDMLKKGWVLPEYKEQVLQSNVGSIELGTMRILNTEMWNEFMGQNFAGSSEGTFVKIETIRQVFVDNCVKNRDGEDSDLVKQLSTLNYIGKAGLLGGLVDVFGGVLTTAASSVVNAYVPW